MDSFSLNIIKAHKGSCGKVMVLHRSVSHSVVEGVSLTKRSPGQRPSRQRPPYDKERVVRILLECILVNNKNNLQKVCFTEMSNNHHQMSF